MPAVHIHCRQWTPHQESAPGFNEFDQNKGKKSNPSRQAHIANEQWPLSLSHILTKHLHHSAGGVQLHPQLGLSPRHPFCPCSLCWPSPSCSSQNWSRLVVASPAPLLSQPTWPLSPHTFSSAPRASFPTHSPALTPGLGASPAPSRSPGCPRPRAQTSCPQLAPCPPGLCWEDDAKLQKQEKSKALKYPASILGEQTSIQVH